MNTATVKHTDIYREYSYILHKRLPMAIL